MKRVRVSKVGARWQKKKTEVPKQADDLDIEMGGRWPEIEGTAFIKEQKTKESKSC